MRVFLNGKDIGEHDAFNLLIAVAPEGETCGAASVILGGGPLTVQAQNPGEAGLYLAAMRARQYPHEPALTLTGYKGEGPRHWPSYEVGPRCTGCGQPLYSHGPEGCWALRRRLDNFEDPR